MAESVSIFDVEILGGVLNLSFGTGIYRVENEGGATADQITSVTGASFPHLYELRVKTSGHWWTIEHNPSGGIFLGYGLGFVTENARDKMILRADETGGSVSEYWRIVIPST